VLFNAATCRPYILNGTASAIWDLCRRPRDTAAIVRHLREGYGVSAARAGRDVKKFLAKMRRAGIMRREI